MAEKKISSRFCIQFNANDSRHVQVMDVLNRQGRHKAQYIASAVLHYINCKETPPAPQDELAFRYAVEAIVTEVLKRNSSPLQRDIAAEKPKQKLRHSSETETEDAGLDAATIAAINESIAGFRSLSNK